MPSVRADFDRLPRDWWRDPLIAQITYDRIGQLIRSGHTHSEIARAVGCSERAVVRYNRRGRAVAITRTVVKLDEDAVREIRSRRETGEFTAILATDYGVSMTTIQRVVRYATWTQVI